MFAAQWTRSTSDNRINPRSRDRIGAIFMAAERVERRLSAIFVADVAGYSRLMGADEEGTHARLNEHLSALLIPRSNSTAGGSSEAPVTETPVEFASVVHAMRCAIAIQRGMITRNADVPTEMRIEFRIGINAGDIIIEGGDIFGDGVNVAAPARGTLRAWRHLCVAPCARRYAG